MKQKKFIAVVAVVLVLVLSFGVFAACHKKKKNTAAPTYTLHDYMGATPLDWNPHTWETSADSVIAGYAEMGLVDVTIAENGIDFEWVYEMAESITDVTAQYAGQTLGGSAIVPDGVTEGQVYRIALNKNAKWANGEAINADTYVESMKRLLDPKMQNYRANTYYSGDSAVKNADKYFKSGAPIYKPLALDTDEDDHIDTYLDLNSLETPDKSYYVSMSLDVPFIGASAAWLIDYNSAYYNYFYLPDYDENGDLQYEEDQEGDYVLVGNEYVEYDANNPDHANLDRYSVVLYNVYDKYKELQDPYGVYKIPEADFNDVKAEFLALSQNFGDDGANAWLEWFLYHDGYGAEYSWDGVGFKKVDDYTVDYILEDACERFYFLTAMTSNWLVYAPLYDSLKTKVGELYTTTYGTSVETYMSYGPYKLTSFQKDKQFKFAKNDQWYGWNDGNHVGQFQTTDIVIDVVTNSTTAENMFLHGQLDSLALNASQLSTYRTSEYLLKTDQTYTFRFIFATDKNKLAALSTQYGNTNLRILSYKDFRKALSLSIDRAQFAAQATGGYKPAYSLYSSLYYYDVAHDSTSIYRRTDEAMQAICDLYGVEWGAGTNYPTLKEAYDSITGQDLTQAKALFTQAYNAAKAAGDYNDGDLITIHCMASAAQELDEDDLAQQRLLTAYVTEATKGTPLEGKITFEFECGAEKRYEDVAAGRKEMIRGAWGGAAFYPFSSIRCYTSSIYMKGLAKIHESCGWDPTTETLTLSVDLNGNGTVDADEQNVTRTLEEWAEAINSGIKNADDTYRIAPIQSMDAKLYVMSKLELAVLSSYQCIPWATETACALFSQKISYATLNYNIMYGYGGIRLMTYNYNDAEWDSYVASKGTAGLSY